MNRFPSLVCPFIVVLIMLGCAGSGHDIRKYASYNLTEDEDRLWDLSAQELNKIEKQGKFEAAPELEKSLSQLLGLFLDPITRKHFPIQTKLLYSSEVNAFTFGNGTIVVSLGMVAFNKNIDMLSFVIGHEAAHLKHRDGLKFYTKMKSKKALLNLGSLLPGIDLIVAWAAAGSLAGFSRAQELAADSFAIRAVAQNGFRKDSGREVMQLFDELSQFLQIPKHTFFASHPNSAARNKNLQTYLANLPSLSNTKYSFWRGHYDSLVASSRAKVGKILLQQKQYKLLNYLLDYPKTGWENQAALLRAELIYETVTDSASLSQLVSKALLEVKNPDAHPDCFRILGLACFKDETWRQAKQHLAKYLALKKTAKDRLYIQGLIEQCEQHEH